ncbi:hypothetical protein, partial [Parapedobacter tibetensis]|uniref:hypothetical protein n=1 Tax=Parapedobacter tibetensis TaxID=2972951 RepID=UPI00214D25AF
FHAPKLGNRIRANKKSGIIRYYRAFGGYFPGISGHNARPNGLFNPLTVPLERLRVSLKRLRVSLRG